MWAFGDEWRPERVERARSAAELANALGAPCEVVALFAGGGFQQIASRRVAREQGLPAVQRLRGDLAGVIHAHQGRALATFFGRQVGVGEASGGRGTGCGGRRGKRPEPLIERADQSIGPGLGGRRNNIN